MTTKRLRHIEKYWAVIVWESAQSPYFISADNKNAGGIHPPLLFETRKEARAFIKSELFPIGANPRAVKVELVQVN